jgi:outer membrane biosynthesis protein TonB
VRFKSLLIGTALVSALLGAVVAYLVLTVPNDVQAGALLRQAQADIKQGNGERARQALGQVVQQYPRTDAAAAAAVALSALEVRDREKLAHELETVRRTVNAQTLRIDALTQKVNTPPPAPPPAPAPVVAEKPAPPVVEKPAPAKAKPKASPPPTRRSRKVHRR